MSIQRYIAMKSSLFLPYDADQAPPKGCMVVVTYADHVAALAQAKRAHREALAEFMGGAYEQGQRDALAAIAEAEKEAYHRGYKSAASEFLTPAMPRAMSRASGTRSPGRWTESWGCSLDRGPRTA